MSDEPRTDAELRRFETLWPRFCAQIVDGVVLAPVFLIAGWIDPHLPRLPALLLELACAAIGIVYFIVLTGLHGQTLGKRALNVKVLDLGEGPLSMRQAVLRESPWLVLFGLQALAGFLMLGGGGGGEPAAGETWLGYALNLGLPSLVILIDAIPVLFNPKRRAVHDWIAGSVVVYLPDVAIARAAAGTEAR